MSALGDLEGGIRFKNLDVNSYRFKYVASLLLGSGIAFRMGLGDLISPTGSEAI